MLDLVEAGRPVVDVARDLGVSAQSIYTWHPQDRVDKGFEPGMSAEMAELVVGVGSGDTGIAELETELKAARRAADMLKERPQKGRFAAVQVMVAEGLSAQGSCRTLDVSESGYHAWRSRSPSARTM